MSKPMLSRGDIVIIALAALYVIMPFDFIPEIIAGPLGLTDDVAAAAVIGATLLRARRAPDAAGPAPGEATVHPV